MSDRDDLPAVPDHEVDAVVHGEVPANVPRTVPELAIREDVRWRLLRRDLRRRDRLVYAGLIVAAVGVIVALFLTKQVNDRRVDAFTRQTILSCQSGNVARTALVGLQLVVIDSYAQALGLPEARRARSAAEVLERLQPLLVPGSATGPRDCDGDGRVGLDDYPLGRGPSALLDQRGLPRLPLP